MTQPKPELPENEAHAMNTQLCGFALRWRVDGDYMRCKACDRPQLAGNAGQVFRHVDGCKNGLGAERHPWLEFLRITAPITRAAAPQPESVQVASNSGETLSNGARDGWTPVAERLPTEGVMALVYWTEEGEERFDFDAVEEGLWVRHSEHYDNYLSVALPENSRGPSEQAPYTHWRVIDAPTPKAAP